MKKNKQRHGTFVQEYLFFLLPDHKIAAPQRKETGLRPLTPSLDLLIAAEALWPFEDVNNIS